MSLCSGWVELGAVEFGLCQIPIESGFVELGSAKSRSVGLGIGRSDWFGLDRIQ